MTITMCEGAQEADAARSAPAHAKTPNMQNTANLDLTRKRSAPISSSRSAPSRVQVRASVSSYAITPTLGHVFIHPFECRVTKHPKLIIQSLQRVTVGAGNRGKTAGTG